MTQTLSIYPTLFFSLCIYFIAQSFKRTFLEQETFQCLCFEIIQWKSFQRGTKWDSCTAHCRASYKVCVSTGDFVIHAKYLWRVKILRTHRLHLHPFLHSCMDSVLCTDTDMQSSLLADWEVRFEGKTLPLKTCLGLLKTRVVQKPRKKCRNQALRKHFCNK